MSWHSLPGWTRHMILCNPPWKGNKSLTAFPVSEQQLTVLSAFSLQFDGLLYNSPLIFLDSPLLLLFSSFIIKNHHHFIFQHFFLTRKVLCFVLFPPHHPSTVALSQRCIHPGTFTSSTMTTPSTTSPSGPENLVTVKVLYNDSNRRFKMPLRELKAQVFPQMVSLHSSSSSGSVVRLHSLSSAIIRSCFMSSKYFLPTLNKRIRIVFLFFRKLTWRFWFSLGNCSGFRRMSTSSLNAIPTVLVLTFA